MQEGLAVLYHTLGKQIPNGRKPDIRAFETCLCAKINKDGWTNAEIQEIVVRWRHFSFLRRLYADENVIKEFESFRAAFASGLTPEEGPIIVLPGLDNATVEASRINKVRSMQNSRFAGDFKARFHKVLCLDSMAIIGLHFAKISTVSPTAPEPKPEDPDVAEMIEHLWIKEDSVAGGETTEFGLETQLDGLEVFDFLYMFLLRKILPYQSLASWIGNDTGDHPFEWRVAGVTNALELPEWYSFLQHCRKALQPDDLVGLIENRTWAGWHNGPPNKSMYMRVHGIFERGDQNDLGFDWNRDFERWSMVRGVYATVEEPFPDAEDPCWWDDVRLRLGSPFLEDSEYKYQDVLNEMLYRDRKEEEAMEDILRDEMRKKGQAWLER